jgi:hypothetical protein
MRFSLDTTPAPLPELLGHIGTAFLIGARVLSATLRSKIEAPVSPTGGLALFQSGV